MHRIAITALAADHCLMQSARSHGSPCLRHHAASHPRTPRASRPSKRARARCDTIAASMFHNHEEIVTVVPNPAVSNFPVPTDLEKYIYRPEIARANMVTAPSQVCTACGGQAVLRYRLMSSSQMHAHRRLPAICTLAAHSTHLPLVTRAGP